MGVQIGKLKFAWNGINKSTKRKFKSFLVPLSLANNNYKKLRVHAQSTQGFAIPFLGVLLQDLTFLNDATSDRIDGLINFEKYLQFERLLSEKMNACRSNMKIVPDIALQQKILKDLDSWIWLKKPLIQAMIRDANKSDAVEQEEDQS